MGRMRVLLAITLSGLGIAGVGAASASDLPFAQTAADSAGYSAVGRHSGMLWTYDDQPGVVVRAYWCAPWRDQHYFPATGIPPRIGRYENLSAVSRPPKPAKTFRRSWSNAWALEREQSASVQPLGIQGDTEPSSQSGTRHRPHAHGSHRIRKR
jgi:hypothetical protein